MKRATAHIPIHRELDINRLTPENGDYEIDLQEGKRFGDKRDVAEERFFVQVKRELMRRPTFSSFNALLASFVFVIYSQSVIRVYRTYAHDPSISNTTEQLCGRNREDGSLD